MKKIMKAAGIFLLATALFMGCENPSTPNLNLPNSSTEQTGGNQTPSGEASSTETTTTPNTSEQTATDSTTPATPSQPAADSTTPATPSQPAADSTTPVTPSQPAADSTTPTTPSQPAADSTTPVTPSQPAANPTTPTTPEQTPTNPTTPTTPEQTPTNPTTPTTPEQTPTNPSTPTTPEQTPANPSTPTTPEQTPANPTTPSTPEQTPDNPTTPSTPEQTPTNPSTPTTPTTPEQTPADTIPEVVLNRLEIPAGYSYTEAGTQDATTFDGYLVKMEDKLDKSKIAAGKKYKISISGKALTNLTLKSIGGAANPQLNIQIVDIAPAANYWNSLGEATVDLVPDSNGNISISTTIDITKNLCDTATSAMLFIKINQDDTTKQDYFKNGKYIIGATADETLPAATNDVTPGSTTPSNQPLYDIDFTKLNGKTISAAYDFINYDSVSGESKGSISTEGLSLNVDNSWDGAFKIAVNPLNLSQVKKIAVEYKVSNNWTWTNNDNNKFNVMLVSEEDASYKATKVDLTDFGVNATNTDFQIDEQTNIYSKTWDGASGADRTNIIAIKINTQSGKGTVTIKSIKFLTE